MKKFQFRYSNYIRQLWKLLNRIIKFTLRFTKQTIKSILNLSKQLYYLLPFSNQTKITHYKFFIKYFPRFLILLSTCYTPVFRRPVSILEKTRMYIKGMLSYASRIYQLLPINQRRKNVHFKFLCKNFPTIIEIIYPNWFLQMRARDLDLPVSANPLISVIIPIYGKIEYTIRCLLSISAHPPRANCEIIIVNDCSLDDSMAILSKIIGLRLLSNPENVGFIRSCNAGAKSARGKYLYFLNNDTEVTPGWMDELFRTFDEFPGTGFAGSKLIYPNGLLQEAGGIIWQDGSAWNFGRFQDAQLPIYNYAREVDYCSGASIMTPKALFDEINGFDELYLPAYYEDADLALKIRDRGYRVIYQPLSIVIHHEGITSGTDANKGIKAYQTANCKKFFERWSHRLSGYQANGVDVDRAKDRRASFRILVIDMCTPTPNQDAGSVSVFNTLLLLREMDFQITFIPEDNFLYLPKYTPALQRAGVEVLYAPYIYNVKQHVKEFGERYDLVLLIRPIVIDRHLNIIRAYCTKAKILYYTVDLHFLRMSREAALQSNTAKQKAAEKMKELELYAICNADASLIHSQSELEIIKPLLPEAVLHLFPLIMGAKGTHKTFTERKDIIFVGGYQHTPNVDAVQYFVSEVLPLIRKKLLGVRFYVVGSHPTLQIQALASEDVIIVGFVEELSSILHKMRISVAPLRYGAGIKGKIITSMGAGLPVVATSLAAEGMSLCDGENIIVVDGAEAFANGIIKIYENEALWKKISQNGIAFTNATSGAEAAWKTLEKIISQTGISVNQKKFDLSLYSNNDISD